VLVKGEPSHRAIRDEASGSLDVYRHGVERLSIPDSRQDVTGKLVAISTC
jgi:hypothetical protein